MRAKLLIILFIATCPLVMAQSKSHREVAKAVEVFKTALLTGYRSQLDAIASSHLSYGHSSGRIEDKSSFVETLATGVSDFVKISITDQTIDIAGKTALVRHKLFADINDNGKAGTVSLGVLLVFQKEQGHWKLLARQAFKL